MTVPRHVPRQGDNPDRFINPDGGPPPLHLVWRDPMLTLCEDSTGLFVGPKDRRLPKLGIIGFNVRGVAHHATAAKQGNFTTGITLTLIREPDNPHDPNAVAVADHTGRYVAGYVNRGNASRIAKQLDAGQPLAALSLQGTGYGWNCPRVGVLVASPELMVHLLRRLSSTAPPDHAES